MSRPAKSEIPWYFVCENCDCKFFHGTSPCDCPRCGETLVSRERIQPPWRTKLHTVAEAAGILNCSESTVYDLIAKGRLGSHRCPGLRISNQQIEEFLEATKQQPVARSERKASVARIRLKHVHL